MPKLPEEFEGEIKPSVEEAKIALIGAGYYRLSEVDKKVIAGKMETLVFVQDAVLHNGAAALQTTVLQGEGKKK